MARVAETPRTTQQLEEDDADDQAEREPDCHKRDVAHDLSPISQVIAAGTNAITIANGATTDRSSTPSIDTINIATAIATGLAASAGLR
jgi:hypothetical protein